MFKQSNTHKARNLAVFAGCVLFWFLFDRVTKVYLDSSFSRGDVIVPDIFGLVRFDLVHNTGAAWGSFSDSTLMLAFVSVVICILILVLTWFESPHASLFEMLGLALVFAGGIGNMVDRFMYGYVVDFITPLFIDFPTFNIADIGVTCGVVMVLISLGSTLLKDYKEGKNDGA